MCLLLRTPPSSVGFIVLSAPVIIHRYVPGKTSIADSSKSRLSQFSIKVSDAGTVQNVLKTKLRNLVGVVLVSWLFLRAGVGENELSLSLVLRMFLITLRSKLWETYIICSTKAKKATYVEWKVKETRGCVFQLKENSKWLFVS